jgi:tetratricopeptide (TPR) repeat protein
LDVWDWAPGDDFVSAMVAALKRAERMVAVWTPAYFTRPYTQVEYRAAFAAHATGGDRRVVPVLAEACEIPELYATLVPIDLVTAEGEDEARRRLLDGMTGPVGPPKQAKAFPGRATSSTRSPISPDGPAAFPGGLPTVWRVPPRNPLFTGRAAALAQLRRRLRDNAVLAVQGGGGLGKTQLVTEYTWRHAGDYDLVWWVNAETETDLLTGLAALAHRLGLPTSGVPATVLAQQVLVALHHRNRWLLIYDNVDTASLGSLRPPPTGHLLLTSREPGIARVSGDVVEAAEFDRSESLELISRHLPNLEPRQANQLANGVGDLPLAVEQAAAFVMDSGLDVDDYLVLLGSHPDKAGLNEPTGDQHAGLAAVVATGRDRLEASAPEAGEFLDSMAFLAATPIRLTPTPGKGGGAVVVGDPVVTANVVRHVCRLGLARRVGASLQVHPLVQLLLRAQIPAERSDAVLAGALDLLGTAAPADPNEPSTWPVYRRLTPHVQAVTSRLADRPGVTEPAAFRRLLLGASRYLFVTAQYLAARQLAGEAHERWTAAFREDHPDTLRALSNLAANLRALGDFERALDLTQSAVERFRRTLGDGHPDTLWAASNLAVSFHEMGEIVRARELDEATFAGYRRVLGENHPDTLRSANNLAADLRALGEVNRAFELDQDTFARRQALGEDHPDALWSANNLALDLYQLGDRDRACALLRDTLDRRWRVLGPDHPETRRTADNLQRYCE